MPVRVLKCVRERAVGRRVLGCVWSGHGERRSVKGRLKRKRERDPKGMDERARVWNGIRLMKRRKEGEEE